MLGAGVPEAAVDVDGDLGRAEDEVGAARHAFQRPAVDAVAELAGDELAVRLRAPLSGVAPGQTLVMYRPDPDGDEVLASATIARAV